MNIYIDFDRTIFNTDKFLMDLDDILTLYGIDVSLFLEYVKRNNEQGFNPYIILNRMEKKLEFNKDIYGKINSLVKHSSSYIYDDVYDFLKLAKEKKYKLFILTKGNEEYQLSKIRNTSLLDYIDGVLVTLKFKGELDLNYQESIFIDDNPKEIESLIKKNPKMIYRIMRDNAKYNKIEIIEDVKTITNLKNIFV